MSNVSVNLSPFAAKIRTIISSSIDENFKQEGRFGNGPLGGGNTKWEKSNRARSESGQTLSDTAQLASSIKVTVTGGGFLMIKETPNGLIFDIDNKGFDISMGSNKPYAPIHQFGGDVNVSITDQMRKFFWFKHFSERKSAVKELRKIAKARGDKLSKKTIKQESKTFTSKWMGMALTKQPSFKFTLPARPYLVVQDEDLDNIAIHWADYLAKKFK